MENNFHFEIVDEIPTGSERVLGRFINSSLINKCINRDLDVGYFRYYSDALYAFSPNGECWYKITLLIKED